MPESTAGLVLPADDPDAPVRGSFVHRVLYNLDPARQGAAQGEVPAEAMAGASGFGDPVTPGQPRRPAMTRTTTYSVCSRSMSRSG